MILPYHVDVAMDRVPFANWILITFTCVVTFLAWGIDSKRTEIEIDPKVFEDFNPQNQKSIERLEQKILESQAPLFSLQREHFAFYQLVTHMFVHGGIWHLGGNMLVLFIFGNAINGKSRKLLPQIRASFNLCDS